MAFLREDFKVDEGKSSNSANYMKLQSGENRIRILSEAIDGYVYWVDNNGIVPKNNKGGEGSKPVRARSYAECEARHVGSQYEAKQFITFVVWNYATKAMQILEVTSKQIIKGIQALANSSDWGDPTMYDIVINKTGEKLETEYSVRPIPPKPFTENVEGLNKINLQALYDGGDPFAENVTPSEVTSSPF